MAGPYNYPSKPLPSHVTPHLIYSGTRTQPANSPHIRAAANDGTRMQPVNRPHIRGSN